MGKQYLHLSAAQRSFIEVFCNHGASYAGVARLIGRHRNTVMHECRRGLWKPMSLYTAEFGMRHYAQGRRNAGAFCPPETGATVQWYDLAGNVAWRASGAPPAAWQGLTLDKAIT